MMLRPNLKVDQGHLHLQESLDIGRFLKKGFDPSSRMYFRKKTY